MFFAVGRQTKQLTPHAGACGRFCVGSFVPVGEQGGHGSSCDCTTSAVALRKVATENTICCSREEETP